MLILAATAVFVLYIAYRLTKVDYNLPGIPRFGKPGSRGFIAAACRFVFDAENCVDEGWAQFSGRPFMVPTLASLVLFTNSLLTRPPTGRADHSFRSPAP
jgi:hypothetical protein